MGRRDAILDSAEDLIRKEGSTHLTLDKVAEHAKVSKGGLLYHFPSKEHLIAGLIARTVAYFDRDLEKARQDIPDAPGKNAVAFLRASLEGPWAKDAASPWEPLDVFASTLAAFATDPKLVTPLREAYARWQRDLEADGVDPLQATVIRLAVDGFWYTELFGFDQFTGERRRQIIAALQRMCLPPGQPVPVPKENEPMADKEQRSSAR